MDAGFFVLAMGVVVGMVALGYMARHREEYGEDD